MWTTLKTQKQLHAYAKEQLNEIGECHSIKTSHPSKWDMFLFYFKRHPNYPEKFEGLTDIRIGRNADPPHYLEVNLIKENGDTESCSLLRACISGKKKNKIAEAMRQAIYPQILTFKKQNIQRCVECDSWDNPQVDHHEPQFAELKANFLKDHTPPTAFGETKAYKTIFLPKDRDFENKWSEYHETHATLRILCRKCNLARPKRLR
jgi:hypothetical protein